MPFCLHVDFRHNNLSLHFESFMDYRMNEKTRHFYNDKNLAWNKKTKNIEIVYHFYTRYVYTRNVSLKCLEVFRNV